MHLSGCCKITQCELTSEWNGWVGFALTSLFMHSSQTSVIDWLSKTGLPSSVFMLNILPSPVVQTRECTHDGAVGVVGIRAVNCNDFLQRNARKKLERSLPAPVR